MSICANVVLAAGQLVAELSDGREIRGRDHRDLAVALIRTGVSADALAFQWRAGLCMITAGQQSALCAEVRRLERQPDEPRRAERLVATS